MRGIEVTKRAAFRSRIVSIIHAVSKAPNGIHIAEECLSLAEMLLEKNRAYGDSALNPIRVFSKVDDIEQIRVRIDDKLSRLARGTGFENEDVVSDLLGYLILLRIASRKLVEKNARFEAAFSPSPTPKKSKALKHQDRFAAGGDIQDEPLPEVTKQASNDPLLRCQTCGEMCLQPNSAICDSCYRLQFGREKVDLSYIQG